MILGCTCGVVCALLLIFSRAFELFFINAAIAGGMSIMEPSLQTIYINLAPPGKRGAVQGSFSSIMVACNFVGPLVYNFLFTYFLQPRWGFKTAQPSAPYVLAAGLAVLNWLIIVMLPRDLCP